MIIATRNINRSQTALDDIRKRNPRANVSLMMLDLASFASVRQFVNSFRAEEQKLDILINNAGVPLPQPEPRRSIDGFELQFATNYLGN